MTDTTQTAEKFGDQLKVLETDMQAAAKAASGIGREIEGLGGASKQAKREMRSFSQSLSREFSAAFASLIFDSTRASEALRNIGQYLVETTFSRAISPVSDALAGLATSGLESLFGSLLANKNGNAFSEGQVAAFARGGIVDGPTVFPMRAGMGLMGEAGPEAVLPLARGADGKLGVAAQGKGTSVHVTMNISTPDAQSFVRSRSQIAAQISRAVERGRRNY